MAACVHLGIGCITRIANNKLNIIICIIAAFIPDILFIPFELLRINGVFWTHSLFMASLLSICFGILTFFVYKSLKISLVIFATSLSHWIIDFITWPMSAVWPNAKGLPLFFGKTIYVGLGLYQSLSVTIITEVFSLVLSIFIIITLRKKNRDKIAKE